MWKIIRQIKKNRAIVLTTHSMEEAEALSDRIGIICDGSLKCIGTPLFLRTTYGEGYRISILTNKDNVE